MLAHKASKEARMAVEVITGEYSAFENIIIPAVVFTDPEVAWCGLTEAEAQGKRGSKWRSPNFRGQLRGGRSALTARMV